MGRLSGPADRALAAALVVAFLAGPVLALAARGTALVLAAIVVYAALATVVFIAVGAISRDVGMSRGQVFLTPFRKRGPADED